MLATRSQAADGGEKSRLRGVVARFMGACLAFRVRPDCRLIVLPFWCRTRIAIEAGVTYRWRKYVGLDGVDISRLVDVLYHHFGVAVEGVVEAARRL